MKKHPTSFISHLSSQKGFTLVELLVSIVVVVAVGSVVTGIATSFLRGANKTNTIENIRQNGNYALSQMSKNIEYAQVFEGLSADGENYVTNCPSPTPMEFNSIKVIPLNRNSTVYKCTDDSELTATELTNNEVTPAVSLSLVDTDSVSLTECKFTCTQNLATDIPVIGIEFKLGPKNQNNLAENSSPPVLFKTSITVRNYKK